MGADDLAMPHIQMANIACGFHASDPDVMATTIQLAGKHGVKIGAHPGYPDLQGFGRRSLPMDSQSITHMLTYQIGALNALCTAYGQKMEYVKPHGALYNDMMHDERIFTAICNAVSPFSVPLMILATADNEKFLDIADDYDIPLYFEAFADRRYLSDGKLAPRSLSGSVIETREEILNQVLQIAKYQKVATLDNCFIPIQADTICVHGDNLQAIEVIQQIKNALEAI